MKPPRLDLRETRRVARRGVRWRGVALYCVVACLVLAHRRVSTVYACACMVCVRLRVRVLVRVLVRVQVRMLSSLVRVCACMCACGQV